PSIPPLLHTIFTRCTHVTCCFQPCCYHRDLHSFPTRRSSDLRDLFPLGPLSGEAAGHSRQRGGGRRRGGRPGRDQPQARRPRRLDRKSTRLNSSHVKISYAVFCLKKKKKKKNHTNTKRHIVVV